MNNAYMIYQAERTMTAAEQRAADRRNGELAAYLAGVWHSLTAPQRFRRPNRRGHQPGWRITEPGPALCRTVAASSAAVPAAGRSERRRSDVRS